MCIRDSAQDVPLLADHFIRTICAEYGIPPKRIESNALRETSNRPSLVLPRLGYVMKIPQQYADFTYYGRGPRNIK